MNEPSAAALSKKHRLIFEIVREQGIGRHLGMADIFNLAKARQPGIGFTTVYRALVRLRNLNLVSEIALPGADCAYYESAGQPHAHFRCAVCGSRSRRRIRRTRIGNRTYPRRAGRHRRARNRRSRGTLRKLRTVEG